MSKINEKNQLIFISTILLLIIIFLATLLVIKTKKFNNETINENCHEVDIKFDSKKKNIYFFRGEGCPHCASELEYLKKIYSKYNKDYKIYVFETWQNKDNEKLLSEIEAVLGIEEQGVPLIVIGDNYHLGYGEKVNNIIIELLEKEKKNENYVDVYKKVLENRKKE